MNAIPKQTANIPAWQTERQSILQRACQSINFRRARGEKLKAILPRVARRYRGQPFKAAPAKRLALTPATLRRLWLAWKRCGEVPAAFKLNYAIARPRVPAPLLVRFVEFVAARPFRSLSAAWQSFASQPINQRTAGRYSLAQVKYSFPVSEFRALQAELATIQAAQGRLAQLRLQFTGQIQAACPARVPAPRLNPGNDFAI